MSTTPRLLSIPVELKSSIGPEGATEYGQLLMVLEESQGRFAPLFVRSDLSESARRALLDLLERDLGPSVPMRTVRVSREEWNPIPSLVAAASSLHETGVLVLLGLEDTPGIISVPGQRPGRPPALACLNHGREALRRSCHCPIVIWCDELTYVALREHAPDFLDHFAGLFRFRDMRPKTPVRMREGIAARDEAHSTAQPELSAGSETAVKFLRRKLAQTPEGTLEHARLLTALAESLWRLRDRDPVVDPREALAAAEKAVGILRHADDRQEFATACAVLGGILVDTPGGDPTANLRRAIECFESALRVYTETDLSWEWAMTQYNLGNAYGALPTGDRGENLRRAIACFESALLVYSETDFPVRWAGTQSNLGNAYRHLPTGDREANLRRAIACYESALRVYTETDFPADWAMTQNNLGNAYSDLPTGDRGENLRRAIACYESALRVRTEADFPSEWADTNFNLGLALREIEQFDESVAAFESAIRGYESVGDAAKAENARNAAEKSRRMKDSTRLPS
ncbi:MAG: tetratricopeptide repeat protein [Isosphaeraceae bacterium]